jgi:phosphoadenosine phosphosulfate reductase
MIANLEVIPPSLDSEFEPGSSLTPETVAWLDTQFGSMTAEEVLAWAWLRFGQRAAIGTSFQSAGVLMIDLARKNGFDFPVFTLDTGFLFPETIALKKRLERFYDFEIESLVPDISPEQQETAHGPALWTRDPDLCCTMRKVLPLRDKLRDLDCWITGLRRQQSATRAGIGMIELYKFSDTEGRDIVKLNPVANWSREEVWTYVRGNHLPYNPLHDAGYRSIGCVHCTRKTSRDADERAGRWVGSAKVECGIHTFMEPHRSQPR